MGTSVQFLNPSEAAKRLGVSAKALRLYEQHGLLKPIRTAAGWRTYGPAEMAQAAEVVTLRALGLSLAHIRRLLGGDQENLEPVLAAHQAALEHHIRRLATTVEMVRGLRSDLLQGKTTTLGQLTRLARPASEPTVVFDLPWPWGGEAFALRDIRRLNYIVGPLGSGKTRLARAIAEKLPGAAFIDLERLADGGAQAQARMETEPALKARVEQAVTWLSEDGAQVSPALIALLVEVECEGRATLVIDTVEQGLGQATQQALIAYLLRRGPDACPLFLLTRSNAILDLAALGPEEAVILCPANHSPPTRVAPYPGAPGYEAVATCLASPEVRKRTEGVIAMRPQVA